MSNCSLDHHHQEDIFAQNERRTKLVLYLNVLVMVAEIVFGYISGSMALLADGWHMVSHTLALGLSVIVYWLYRQAWFKNKFTFGGGKILSLGGYSSAITLVFISIGMIVESIERLFGINHIHFDLAIAVSLIGLVVNLAGVLILKGGMPHSHDHDHEHDHRSDHHHHDHNHEGAYLHLLTDALTSILAIVALLVSKFYGIMWFDPAMGIVGGVLVLRWSVKLIKSSAHDLLDAHDASIDREDLIKGLEVDGTVVTDLHIWRLGPGHIACEIFLKPVKEQKMSFYRQKILNKISVQHLVIQLDD